MKYVYIGEITNTHGIKGELRIISEFKYKENVFKENMKIYLGNRRQEMIIHSYRPHKNYDMITLEGINDINEAIAFKGDSVYINREDLKIDDYVKEDLIGLNVYYLDKLIGTITNVIHNPKQDVLTIEKDNKRNLIPYVIEFVKKIDLKNNRMDIDVIEGLIDEN